MFYNYFRNAVRLRACALHYTRDHPCLHSQYLLFRVECSAHVLTCRRRKVNFILCLHPSARTQHGTTHSEGPPYTSVVFTSTATNLECSYGIHGKRSLLAVANCGIFGEGMRRKIDVIYVVAGTTVKMI